MSTTPKQYAERACKECGVPFTPRPYAETLIDFCSTPCKLANGRRCAYCGEPFSTAGSRGPEKQYCSKACRDSMHRARANGDLEPTEESPLSWDGATHYSSARAPMRHVAVCLACGARVGPEDVQAWRDAVLTRRCGWCRGFLVFEAADVGISSPSTATPHGFSARKPRAA